MKIHSKMSARSLLGIGMAAICIAVSPANACKIDLEGCVDTQKFSSGPNGSPSCSEDSDTWKSGKCKGTGHSEDQKCVDENVIKTNSVTLYHRVSVNNVWTCVKTSKTDTQVGIDCPKLVACPANEKNE